MELAVKCAFGRTVIAAAAWMPLALGPELSLEHVHKARKIQGLYP